MQPKGKVDFSKHTPDELNAFCAKTMCDHIGITFTAVGSEWLEAEMPVDERTRQPYGLLHGGANVTLAETLGSVASALVVGDQKKFCVGLEINANHIRGVRAGKVRGRVRPIYIGRTSHVWDIQIFNENNSLTCISRLTVAVMDKLR